jgi:hypothetical protein
MCYHYSKETPRTLGLMEFAVNRKWTKNALSPQVDEF